MEMTQRLQDLLDRVAIEDQIKHYASLIDTKQFHRLEEVLMPGAWIDYTASGGEKGTLEEMRTFLSRSMAPFRSQHLMTNVEVTFSPDRNTATSTHLLFNPMTMDRGGRDYTFFCGLWYDCQWVRVEPEVWKATSMIQRDGYTYHRPLPPKR